MLQKPTRTSIYLSIIAVIDFTKYVAKCISLVLYLVDPYSLYKCHLEILYMYNCTSTNCKQVCNFRTYLLQNPEGHLVVQSLVAGMTYN